MDALRGITELHPAHDFALGATASYDDIVAALRVAGLTLKVLDLRGLPAEIHNTDLIECCIPEYCEHLETILLSTPADLVSFAPLSKSLHRVEFRGVTRLEESHLRAANSLVALRSFSAEGVERLETLGGLVHCPDLTEVDLSRSNISGTVMQELSALRKLRTLRLVSCTNSSLKGLSDCVFRELEELDLSWSAVSQVIVDAISHFAPSLRTLKAVHCPLIEDVAPVRKLQHLRELDVSWLGESPPSVPKEEDDADDEEAVRHRPAISHRGLRGIERFTTLTKLSIAHCTGVNDVGVLRVLTKLRSLDISGTDVTGISIVGLEELPELECLDLNFCSRLDSLGCLATAPKLRRLSAISCMRIDAAAITGLERTVKLQRLLLSECRSLTSASSLADAPSLASLSLCSTAVTNQGIRGLECIPNLTFLDLGRCKEVTDVSSLATAPALRGLRLTGTCVTSEGIAPLQHIQTLVSVDLEGCRHVTNAAALATLPRLAELRLDQTMVGADTIRALGERCTSLQALFLTGCLGVTDLRPLMGPPRLLHVICANTGVPAATALQQIGRRAHLHMCHRHIPRALDESELWT